MKYVNEIDKKDFSANCQIFCCKIYKIKLKNYY